MAAVLIAFVCYVLILRTDYKKTALEINEAFRTTPAESIIVVQGDTELPADAQLTDFYNKFLLYSKTVVFNRKKSETNENTITFKIKGKQLSLTGLEDGSAIAIHWEDSEKEAFYTVRAEMTFQQLSAYFNNYKKKAEKK